MAKRVTAEDMDLSELWLDVEETEAGVRLCWWRGGVVLRVIVITPAQYQLLVNRLGGRGE